MRRVIAQDAAVYEAILWSAIRAGWRDGYSAGLRVTADAGENTIRDAAGFSRFIIEASTGPIEALYDLIRCVREDSGFGGGFDFELVFSALRRNR